MKGLAIMSLILKIMEEKGIVELMKKSLHEFQGIQSKHHLEGSVYTHTALVFKEAASIDINNALLLIAACLHDVGKVFTREEVEEKSKTQFIGHEIYSVNWIRNNITEILKKYMSKEDIFLLYQLVQYHQIHNVKKIFKKNMGKILVDRPTRLRYNSAPVINDTVRHNLNAINTYTNLLRADNNGRHTSYEKDTSGIEAIESECVDQEYTTSFKALSIKTAHFHIMELNVKCSDKQLMILPISVQAGGKTTIKNNLAYEIERDGTSNLVDISFDNFRVNVYKENNDTSGMSSRQIYENAYNYCKDTKQKLLDVAIKEINKHRGGNDIIYVDNMNHSLKARRAFVKMNKKRFYTVAIYLDNTLDFHIVNNEKRRHLDKYIDPYIIEKCYYQTQLPVPELEFDEIIYCS